MKNRSPSPVVVDDRPRTGRRFIVIRYYVDYGGGDDDDTEFANWEKSRDSAQQSVS